MFNNAEDKLNCEQLAAVSVLDKNVIVSAGAGSGKTKVLTMRFVHILEEEGISPESVLAITFTNKAANEMKERIRRRMSQKMEEAAGEAVGKWEKRILELENAQIGTIHGLCSRILMENPLEAGLAPGAELTEDYDLGQFDAECLSSFLREKIDANDSDIIELLTQIPLKKFSSNLSALMKKAPEILAKASDEKSRRENYLNAYDISASAEIGQMEDCLRRLIEEKPEGRSKNKAKAMISGIIANWEDIIKEIHASPPSFKTYRKIFYSPAGNKVTCASISEFLGELENLYNRIISIEYSRTKGKRLCELWLKVLSEYSCYYETEKKKANKYTFDDMEEKTLQLLKVNEAIRRRYQEQFKYIMVDEFQDTNERQKQIIYLLYGDNPNKLEKPADGAKKNLFVVGDPKQSIYRFRGADVSVFHKVWNDIKNLGDTAGKVIPMGINYRSTARLVGAYNAFFPTLMGRDTEKDVYYEDLQSGSSSEGVDVELLFEEYSKNDGKTVPRQKEVGKIADRIAALHKSGEKYGDISVLVRARTHVDEITEALREKGIPYIVTGDRNFYQLPEVFDLLMICKAICSRQNTLELVSALRSPYFGFDERAITDLVLARKGSLWDCLEADNSEKGKQAYDILSKLRQKAQTVGLAAFWDNLWELLKVEQTLLPFRHGDLKLANARKLWKMALDFAEGENGTLTVWVERILAMHDSGSEEKCATVPAADMVTVMTIHSAKGLGFPIVFVPLLDSGSGDKNKELVNFVPNVGLGVKVLDENLNYSKTSVFIDIANAERPGEDEERARLLYVAMTRAERKLILSGLIKKSEMDVEDDLISASWPAQLKYALKTGKDNFCEFVPEEEQNAGENTDSVGEESQRDFEQAAPLPGYAFSGISSFTPSALQCYSHCPRSYYYKYVLNIPALEEKGLGDKARKLADYRGELEAQEFGNLLHRALELYVKGSCERVKLREAFDQSLQDNRLSGDYGEAWDLFQKYVDSPLFLNTVGSAKERLTELRFAYNLDGRFMVKGIIDCLYFDADGNMHIVDYKTGGYHESNEGYAIQLAIYREVANNLYGKDGKKVLDAELHYLPELKAWALGRDGKEDFLKKAKENCRRIVEGSTEDDFPKGEESNCWNCRYRKICKQGGSLC